MKTQSTAISTNDTTTKALLFGGVLAGPLFTIAWIIGGALTAHYDPMRHLISQIALGEFGWIQQANFVIPGFLIVGFALGLRRALRPLGSIWGPLLIGLAGLGLIGSGIFITDPANGYPPNTPLIPTERTTHGHLHDFFASVFIFGLPVAALVVARVLGKLGERRWVIFSVLSGLTTFVVFFLARLNLDDFTHIGLYQRIGVTVNLLWLTLLAIYMLKAWKYRQTAFR